MRHHWTVMLAMSPLGESVSSMDQLAEQWSRITLRLTVPMLIESLSLRVRSPRRLRRKRTTTSWVAMVNRSERRQMPSPGAVWPAMVR